MWFGIIYLLDWFLGCVVLLMLGLGFLWLGLVSGYVAFMGFLRESVGLGLVLLVC